MRIDFVEIKNFRKLESIRIDFAEEKTIFVGANNSGKTSAIIALRRFLIEQKNFDVNDFTISNWRTIDSIGHEWESAPASSHDIAPWQDILPSLDVWLNVRPEEVHHVQHLLPTLDWTGGLIGVRLRLEPKDLEELKGEFVSVRQQAENALVAASKKKGDIPLWPASMKDYLERGFGGKFRVRSYILDPLKISPPVNGVAQIQKLANDVTGSEDNPFSGLIRIDEISAHRGFSDAGDGRETSDDAEDVNSKRSDKRILSEQLRTYYKKHLDPADMPEASDIVALEAIHLAQGIFDERLKTSFSNPIAEIQNLGYPGINDPRITLSTRIKPLDGLNHSSALQYDVIAPSGEKAEVSVRLPEQYNGLGYQNLISMVFRLMSFRDEWMQVGKIRKRAALKSEEEADLAPLHLVLVEEPEAHLHVQVQQVFIRKAYEILRNHEDLGKKTALTTQLIVSTHSSHIAHECEFYSLRYFRRKHASAVGKAPTSAVINLSEVFGKQTDTAKFVARYLKAAHCDLFFADAAIFIEGAAERMLLPHFISKYYPKLNHRYLTLLEVGGSHAHRLKSLVEHLGLVTLVITDIDAVDAVAKGTGQKTKNATLKVWAPQKENIDDLLIATAEEKTVTNKEAGYSIKVAYQTTAKVTLDATKGEVEINANTFEDALVYANVELFKVLEGQGLIKKFRECLSQHTEPLELSAAILKALKSGSKAEFALELLFQKDPQELNVPTYIKEGLAWLETQVSSNDIVQIGNDNDAATPPAQQGAA